MSGTLPCPRVYCTAGLQHMTQHQKSSEFTIVMNAACTVHIEKQQDKTERPMVLMQWPCHGRILFLSGPSPSQSRLTANESTAFLLPNLSIMMENSYELNSSKITIQRFYINCTIKVSLTVGCIVLPLSETFIKVLSLGITAVDRWRDASEWYELWGHKEENPSPHL